MLSRRANSCAELTVELVRRHGCRYVVHLEDNDEVVLSGELGGAEIANLQALPLPVLDRIILPRQSHPLRAARFLERAAGITVLIERLLELVPNGVPAAVIHAGFDEAVLSPARLREQVRDELGLEPDDLAIVYTGNVHALNRDEMSDLYAAIALLRSRGERAVLVKTGWGSGVAATFPPLGDGSETSAGLLAARSRTFLRLPTFSSSRAGPIRSTITASRRSCLNSRHPGGRWSCREPTSASSCATASRR